MRSDLQRASTLFLGCTAILATTPIAFAGTSSPPRSGVTAMPDGKHMLVFLSPVPMAADEGRIAMLPDGRVIDLRTAYPATGYYAIESTQPIWTAPWDNSDLWFVSDDGRFLVRCNIFGDGKYGCGGRLSWGLKFYDHGQHVRAYHVSELVDYPSLMPFTTSDWHFYWIGEGSDNARFENGRFHFTTSTHETYSFDLTTGRIITEWRLWRTVSRFVDFAVGVLGVGFVLVLSRRQRPGTPRIEHGVSEVCAAVVSAPRWEVQRLFKHDVRTELVMMTVIATLCYAIPRWPHAVMFVVTLVVATLLSNLTVRYWRRSRYLPVSRGRWARGLGARLAVAFTAAIVCYVLTIGPVFRLTRCIEDSDDIRKALILTVYRPITWIPDEVLGKNRLLEWYFDEWQDT